MSSADHQSILGQARAALFLDSTLISSETESVLSELGLSFQLFIFSVPNDDSAITLSISRLHKLGIRARPVPDGDREIAALALQAAEEFGVSPEYCVRVDAGPQALATLRALRQAAPVPATYITADEGAARIRDGGVVAIPTETVYGLAAHALNEQAVQRIFDLKKRPAFDPLIVHVATPDGLDAIASDIPEKAQILASTFWPGPLTLVLPKYKHIPALVTSGRDTVAVRIPAHPLARRILRGVNGPVAAPSANLFGTISPTTARHVLDSLGDTMDGIVDGGPCSVGVESTIIGFWDGQVWLLRPGGLRLEAIEEQIGTVRLYRPAHSEDIRAPGTMPRHYSPSTPLVLRAPGEDPTTDSLSPTKTGRLVFGRTAPTHDDFTINLSPTGNLQEAAARLYDALRYLDRAGLDRIEADLVPDIGLGRAINDRLSRAASKTSADK